MSGYLHGVTERTFNALKLIQGGPICYTHGGEGGYLTRPFSKMFNIDAAHWTGWPSSHLAGDLGKEKSITTWN